MLVVLFAFCFGIEPRAPVDSAAPSPADEPAVTLHVFLLEHDADKDGVLSVDEVPESLKRRFARTDSNGDGVLDAREILAGNTRISREARRIEGLRKTRQGLERRGPSSLENEIIFNVDGDLLRRLDHNHDGWADADELATLIQQKGIVFGPTPPLTAHIAPPRLGVTISPLAPDLASGLLPAEPELGNSAMRGVSPAPIESANAPFGFDEESAEIEININDSEDSADPVASMREAEKSATKKEPLPTAEQILDNLDLNEDGLLDRDEAVDQLAANFDRLDKNHDGKLDPDEIRRGLLLARMFGIKPKQDPRQYQKKP